MNNKEVLSEEQYQKSKKKFNIIGTILLIVGGAMLIFGLVMSFGFNKLNFGVFSVIGLAIFGFGSMAKMLGNGREINAFLAQQQMPVAKETVEKMAPSAGTVAKEVTKGIKEGLQEDTNKEETK